MTLQPNTLSAGKEQWQTYLTTILRKTKNLVQYDYRHTDGTLFSCVKPTLEQCRKARDWWLEAKGVVS